MPESGKEPRRLLRSILLNQSELIMCPKRLDALHAPLHTPTHTHNAVGVTLTGNAEAASFLSINLASLPTYLL